MTETTPGAPAKSSKQFYVLILLSVVGIILLNWSFIFFAIGMLPTAVAYFVDREKNKYVFHTVGALNFSGVFQDMVGLRIQAGDLSTVLDRLANPEVWLTMYGAAALGWGIVWLSPTIAGMILEWIYQGRIAHLESVQKKLEDEWGTEINRRKGEE